VPLAIGKLPPALLHELLDGAAAQAPEVVLPAAVGEDACAIAIGGGVLVAATDPVTLTGSEVGAHAVVVNANDVAVMGVRPRWFLAAVLLPPGTDEAGVRALLGGMRRACAAAGVVLVGGHTEVTHAVRQPVVVGQMLGFAPEGRFLRTGAVRAGDAVVQVGPAPVEAAAVLAVERPAADVPEAVRRAARGALDDPGISVVEAALTAAELGARALHDPTEGGLSAGLHEMAEASGVGLVVDPGPVLWFEPGKRICQALGADPWGALASGALLAAVAGDEAAAFRAALRDRGLASAVIARAEAGSGVRTTEGRPLPRYDRDEVARVLDARG